MADFIDEWRALKKTLEPVPINVQNLTDAPDVPAAIVVPDAPLDWHDTFEDDNNKFRFVVYIICPFNDSEGSQEQLMQFLANTGRYSVPAAIESNPHFTVLEMRSFGVMSLTDGGTIYLSAELLVESFS